MKKYEIIFEELINRVNSGELTIEEADSINDVAYDKYVTEKKTTAEYRLQKFKDKYNYDPKTKTIEMHGQKMRFNYTGGSNKKDDTIDAYSLSRGNEARKKEMKEFYKYSGVKPGITMNKASFNQNHPKTHEFIASHEMGHQMQDKNKRLHDRNGNDNDEYSKDKKRFDEYNKKQKATNKHDDKPEELQADNYAKKQIGISNTKKAMKDLDKTQVRTYIKKRVGGRPKYLEKLKKLIELNEHNLQYMMDDPELRDKYMKEIKELKEQYEAEMNGINKVLPKDRQEKKELSLGIEKRKKALKELE